MSDQYPYSSGASDDEDPGEQKVEDVTMAIFYKPRTVLLLLILISWLVYKAFTSDDTLDQKKNLFDGTLGMVVAFSVISMLICPNGMGIMYCLLMVFVLFQSYSDLREILSYIAPELRNAGPDTELYAVDCTLTLAKLWKHMDVFALAHFLGWMVKAMITRHVGMLWLLSITWEATEVAFCHLLPNFQECWWDMILLDVLICNGLGIHLGMYLCKKLEMQQFHWESIK